MQFTKASLISAILAISAHTVRPDPQTLSPTLAPPFFQTRLTTLRPPLQAHASVTAQDIGYPAGGGSSSPACEPACRVQVTDEMGCTGSADFVGNCKSRTGDVTQDVDGCDGFTVEWYVGDAGGDGSIYVTNADGSGTLGYHVTDCKTPTSTGQCVYDGGCTVGS